MQDSISLVAEEKVEVSLKEFLFGYENQCFINPVILRIALYHLTVLSETLISLTSFYALFCFVITREYFACSWILLREKLACWYDGLLDSILCAWAFLQPGFLYKMVLWYVITLKKYGILLFCELSLHD